MLANPTESSATLDCRGNSLLGAQRRGHQDVMAKEGAGVLYLPGDLVNNRQAIGTTGGKWGEPTGGQTGTSEVPEIFAGQQTATCEGNGRGH